jgi:hypothetical protein
LCQSRPEAESPSHRKDSNSALVLHRSGIGKPLAMQTGMSRLAVNGALGAFSSLCLVAFLGLLRCDDAGTPLCTTANEARAAGAAGSAGSPPGVAGSTGAGSVSQAQVAVAPGRTPRACPASFEGGDPQTACASDADCVASSPQPWCRDGKCQGDQCLTDDDCGAAEACACSSEIGGGNISHPNLCLPATCRANADCASGVCSQTRGGHCNGLDGYRCHTAEDTCQSSDDCCGDTSMCSYQPTLGHWACRATTVCNG